MDEQLVLLPGDADVMPPYIIISILLPVLIADLSRLSWLPEPLLLWILMLFYREGSMGGG